MEYGCEKTRMVSDLLMRVRGKGELPSANRPTWSQTSRRYWVRSARGHSHMRILSQTAARRGNFRKHCLPAGLCQASSGMQG